ncbi:MAG TPA: endonuclease [Myxococcota bacterium]|nr:endonuclease [Myxococcota bacterium]HRY96961.1 endonuclease [Myxococcota bacterium]HSA22395.1 endonuclease [Myxococcota bacterium]
MWSAACRLVPLAILAWAVAGCPEEPAPIYDCYRTADCDDLDPCTTDNCTWGACEHTAASDVACDDLDPCSMQDRCVDGACQGLPLDGDQDGHGSPTCGGDDCDDGEPGVHPGAAEGPEGDPSCGDLLDNDCDGLTDTLDEGCITCAQDADCDDGDACDGPERCVDNACLDGEPLDCDDLNPCTLDACTAEGQCHHDYADGVACDDRDACTTADACLTGACTGTPVDLDGDGHAPLACGGDDCDDLRGAVHPGAQEECLDGLDNDCDGRVDTLDGCPAAQDEYAALDGLQGQALRDALRARIDDHDSLGYDSARAYLYSELDNVAGQVQCVYTGTWVTTDGIPDNELMNTEHSFPQSWGSDVLPMRSDLHHLFPALAVANSRRGNAPYGHPTRLFWGQGGSSVGYDARGKVVFEVRPAHAGNAARAVLYYVVRYEVLMNVWPYDDVMEGYLRRWNAQDPPDAAERARCDAIESRQGNRNPFVDRPGFVDRIADF